MENQEVINAAMIEAEVSALRAQLIKQAYWLLQVYMADHECTYEDCDECRLMNDLEKVIMFPSAV